MKRVGILVVAIALFLPVTAQAQNWSAEQQELWEFEKACWEAEDLETVMACVHDDYVGWGDLQPFSTPKNKADLQVLLGRNFETLDIVFLYLKPLEIRIHGNVAVILYVSTLTVKNKATGEEASFADQWTDIAVKQDGKWKLIADHSTPMGAD